MSPAKQTLIRSTLCMLVLMLFASCEGVTLSMDDRNPPSFKFKRNWAEVDRVLVFSVQEIAEENKQLPYLKQSFDKNKILWRVEAANSESGIIENLSAIRYGQVPPGFSQEVPQSGPPPALEEGKLYEAGGPYVTMNSARVRFVIRNGRPEQQPIPNSE